VAGNKEADEPITKSVKRPSPPTSDEGSPLAPADEREAVVAVHHGDKRAFEGIFRAHYAALCGFARRYVGEDGTAEELVQDVFASLWAKRDAWQVTSSVRSYLFAAVRNRALNQRKRGSRDRDWLRNEATAMESFPAVPDTDDELEIEDLLRDLGAAIESLPERCRLVMRLRWRDQLSYAEIAEVMGISVKGVENQLARGLKSLRDRLVTPRR
jgi:RNA polymerase sigma-70 factor (ECF subfamily)